MRRTRISETEMDLQELGQVVLDDASPRSAGLGGAAGGAGPGPATPPERGKYWQEREHRKGEGKAEEATGGTCCHRVENFRPPKTRR